MIYPRQDRTDDQRGDQSLLWSPVAEHELRNRRRGGVVALAVVITAIPFFA